jgi:hydroxymethylpyrimidine pyrophosphatase-like HAD family hydrolase
MRYKLLALDLDGTLLRPGGIVSDAHRGAVDRALSAGLIVVPATGRGWREAQIGLSRLGPVYDRLDLGVFNTGACLARVGTGESVALADFEPRLALELVEHLRPMPEAVLVHMDRHQTGIDYLVTGDGELTDNTQRWLEQNDLRHEVNRRPAADDLHHALRVGLVARGRRAFDICRGVETAFANRIAVHAFAGVPTADGEEQVYIAEVFAAGVNKWQGLQPIMRQHGIAPDEVACIGDEINDLAMLEHAGCGIAMGNAVDEAKAVADRVTLDNQSDGVAVAIDKLLDGSW